MIFTKRNFLLVILVLMNCSVPAFSAAQAPSQTQVKFPTKLKRLVTSTVQTVGDSGKALLAIMTLTLICWWKFKKVSVAQPAHVRMNMPDPNEDNAEIPQAPRERERKVRAAQKPANADLKPQQPSQEPQPQKQDVPPIASEIPKKQENEVKSAVENGAAQQPEQQPNSVAAQPADIASPKPVDQVLNKERDQKHSAPAQNQEQPELERKEKAYEAAAVSEPVSQPIKSQDLSDFASAFENVNPQPTELGWMDRAASVWNSLWKSKPQKTQTAWKPGMQAPCAIPSSP